MMGAKPCTKFFEEMVRVGFLFDVGESAMGVAEVYVQKYKPFKDV